MASEIATFNKSQLLKTAYSVLDGYNKWDIDAILAPRAPDCTQQVLPLRLGRPINSNAAYREYFNTAVKPHFQNFTIEVLDTVEDPKAHKVAIRARSSAETVLGEYTNEYVLVMHMTDDDQKVLQIKEFVDSEYSQEFFPKLRAYLAQS